MKRLAAALVFACAVTSASFAHMAYLVPQQSGKVILIFSDDLEADKKVPISKLGSPKVFVRVGDTDQPVEWKKVENTNALELTIPGEGVRVVHTSIAYGVLQKGDAKPFALNYHAKTILGSPTKANTKLGTPIAELVPVVEGNKVRFQVLSQGKVVPKAEVTVKLPGEKSDKTTTDDTGLTPAYEQTGRYAVYAKVVVNGAGEQDGKKYDEARHYATLVVDHGNAAR